MPFWSLEPARSLFHRSLHRSARPTVALALCLTAAAAACGSSSTKSPGAGGSLGIGGAAGAAGNPATGGSSAGGSGAGGNAGAGGPGAGGSAGAGASGAGGSSCANPQTSFGAIGQGDSNPNFHSGMGALGTNVMYIFSSYNPPAVADVASGDYEVYVQAFDPKSGVSKGPSKSLFVAPLLGLTIGSAGTQSFFVASAAVAPSGEIVVLYFLGVSGGGALYAAFLSPSAAGGSSDGGSVDGLTLQKVVLVDHDHPFDDYPGSPADVTPQVIWSNTSQTFIVSGTNGAGPDDYFLGKYTSNGSAAGGVEPVPTTAESNPNGSGTSIGSVGESGSLLGFAYTCNGGSAAACLTILDESENLVGQPIILAKNLGENSWAGVAGTAKGFVYVYDGQAQTTQFPSGFVGEAFVSTSTDGGVGDAGVATFPGFTFASRAIDGRVVADDIGTGGSAGVGVALVYDGGPVKFAYVNADGAGHQGPYTVIPAGGGPGAMSITNFNGNFAISSYTPATNSAQVIETGICP